jgi:hypothetical protein
MKTIKLAGALAIGSLLLLATGCGKSKALTAAEDYQTATCACKDATCVAAAAKKFADNAQDMATARSSEADAITKATSAATDCAMKVTMAGMPAMPGAPGAPGAAKPR